MNRIAIIVLAHNEERRIARCLASLPVGEDGVAIHVVVNGSTDQTATLARSFAGITVHDWPESGKSRSWNRIMLDTPAVQASEAVVLVDGDAQVTSGSIEALAATLVANPTANAAAGMPRNGRRAEHYRAQMVQERGLFGDLYALSPAFVERWRRSGIRLPEDLIGDDGLVGALAKTDLGPETEWDDARVVPCAAAGFLCEPVSAATPASWRLQYRRMINYSVRHFQNRLISGILQGPGPAALPRRLASLYPASLPGLTARHDPRLWLFDRLALARMARAGGV